jgi:hypothetical protein
VGILVCFLGSFLISQNTAEKIRKNLNNEVSHLKGQLVLFQNDSFNPCWVFRGEYALVMTGATFDVYVSLTGDVLKVPSVDIDHGQVPIKKSKEE